MGKEIITFGDMEIAQHKFHHYKNLNVDITKIQVSNMVSLGEKNSEI